MKLNGDGPTRRANLRPAEGSNPVEQVAAGRSVPEGHGGQTDAAACAKPDSAFAAATLAELFLRSAERHAWRTAAWIDGDGVSYAALLDQARRIAAPLIDAGRADGTRRCAILGRRTLTDYAGILGALLARHTYVPLNLRHPPQRLARALLAAGADSLVVGRDGLDTARALLDAARHPVLVLLPNSDTPPDYARHMPRHRFLCRDALSVPAAHIPPGSADDGAYLLFTSGSTGDPKGVQVHHRNVLPYLRQAAERYGVSPDDRCTQLFDLTFDLSVHDMFLCWGAGATLFRVPDQARFAPARFVARHALTVWFSVPSTAATMLGLRALRPGDLPGLRLSLFCGEALPKRVAMAWADAAPHSVIENIYGPTEATIAITGFTLPRNRDTLAGLPEVVPIGTAFPDQFTAVVDPQGQPVASGEEGELCLAGSQVTDGYWCRPDLTSQRFVRFPWDNEHRLWYRTGDRVRQDPADGLSFLGRLDRQAKIAGHRIELQEVEAVLHRAANANAAALAWPLDADGLARGIVGFVGQTDRSVEAILAACRTVLPPYSVPSAIHRVEDWPLNSSGKTDHRRLRQIVETIPCQTTRS